MKKGVEQVATVSEWVYYETKSLMYPDFYIVECIVTTDHYTYTLESERLYYKPVKYIDDNMKVRCLMDEPRPRCYYVDFRDILPGYPGGEGRRQYVE